MHNSAMFRVLWSEGKGTMEGPRFAKFSDAVRFFDKKKATASVVILNPNGKIARLCKRRQCEAQDEAGIRDGRAKFRTSRSPQ
jgi:hypothetical protein